MFSFPFRLDRGEDPDSGLPVLGFQHEGHFIFEPYRSPDLTAEVNPTQAYGLSREQADQLVRLNNVLVQATRAALAAGCEVIQRELDLPRSGASDVRFTEERTERPIVQTLADYVLREAAAGISTKR